jgi:hypothetical protein
MIKVLIIDNYSPRHEEIRGLIATSLTGVECLFVEEFDVSKIALVAPTVLIVHRNNPEYGMIASDASLAKYRIFFSGSYSGHFKESDYEHYVTVNLLNEALSEVTEHMSS